METKLISNKFSSANVINYFQNLEKAQKMTLQNADKTLSKMRKLVAENPVELLIHHEQLFDRIFMILSTEYEYYDFARSSVVDQNKVMQDEDRQDVAFELLLLMIDLFHGVFPEYKDLLERYLEKHFY